MIKGLVQLSSVGRTLARVLNTVPCSGGRTDTGIVVSEGQRGVLETSAASCESSRAYVQRLLRGTDKAKKEKDY